MSLKIGDKVLVHLVIVDIFGDGQTVRVAEKNDQYATGINVNKDNVTCITEATEQ